MPSLDYSRRYYSMLGYSQSFYSQPNFELICNNYKGLGIGAPFEMKFFKPSELMNYQGGNSAEPVEISDEEEKDESEGLTYTQNLEGLL
jgi:hypothetical protein